MIVKHSLVLLSAAMAISGYTYDSVVTSMYGGCQDVLLGRLSCPGGTAAVKLKSRALVSCQVVSGWCSGGIVPTFYRQYIMSPALRRPGVSAIHLGAQRQNNY